jgi:hypothetical protein
MTFYLSGLMWMYLQKVKSKKPQKKLIFWWHLESYILTKRAGSGSRYVPKYHGSKTLGRLQGTGTVPGEITSSALASQRWIVRHCDASRGLQTKISQTSSLFCIIWRQFCETGAFFTPGFVMRKKSDSGIGDPGWTSMIICFEALETVFTVKNI